MFFLSSLHPPVTHRCLTQWFTIDIPLHPCETTLAMRSSIATDGPASSITVALEICDVPGPTSIHGAPELRNNLYKMSALAAAMLIVTGLLDLASSLDVLHIFRTTNDSHAHAIR